MEKLEDLDPLTKRELERTIEVKLCNHFNYKKSSRDRRTLGTMRNAQEGRRSQRVAYKLAARKRVFRERSEELTSYLDVNGLTLYDASQFLCTKYMSEEETDDERFQENESSPTKLKVFQPAYRSEILCGLVKILNASSGRRRERLERICGFFNISLSRLSNIIKIDTFIFSHCLWLNLSKITCMSRY